jgi:mono/diheme cytochrome c family protein
MNSKVLTASRVVGVVFGVSLWLSLPALAQDDTNLTDARKVAGAVPPKLLNMLNAQIAKDGPASAVAVCNEKAPQMAKAASEQSGWAIRRVSLRNRNPKAVPDAWELAALKDFDQRAAAGETPATLEKFGVVDTASGKEYRYMKALPMQQVCLACHGAADAIAPDVAEKIHTLYPADKATGYSLGDIRGAITIRKAL